MEYLKFMKQRTPITAKIKKWVTGMFPKSTSCEELQKFVGDYVDDVLPEKQRRSFELHFGTCVSCTKYIQNYRKTKAPGQGESDNKHSQDSVAMPDTMVKAIKAARNETS
jgi:hypothetical protein